MGEQIRVLYSEEQISEKIRELGARIHVDCGGEPLRLVCVLKGAAPFGCELAKRISAPVFMEFIYASSYGDAAVSSGTVSITSGKEIPVKGENILIAEDIIDSGRTLKALTALFRERGAKSVKSCVLLDKPSRREVSMEADYVGFVIPDVFVVGYGLDYAQRYRGLPYIGILHLEDEAAKEA